METYWDNLKAIVAGVVWSATPAGATPVRRRLVTGLRVLHMVWRELTEGQLSLRAMSLVYTTLLSIVPLLAVSFSVLKGFGVHQSQLEPALLNLLAALGEDGSLEATSRIMGFVENVDGPLLGGIGLAFLLATVISLLQKVERAFNYAWRVTLPRSFAKRFGDYLIVVIVGPLLVVTAMSIIASLMSTGLVQQLSGVEPFGALLGLAAKLVPFALLFAAFTFAYVFLPNTRVKPVPAMVGAAVGALLWQVAGWGFAAVVVTSTKTIAIYSSFAILILFMFWVYLAWLILLVGTSVAFYVQHPECLGFLGHQSRVGNRLRERVALEAAFLVARHHFHGLPPWTTEAFAARFGLPEKPVAEVLESLAGAGFLVATGDEVPGWVPARDLAAIEVRRVLEVARSTGAGIGPGGARDEPAVAEILSAVDAAVDDALGTRTLRDLAAAHPPPDAAEAPLRGTVALREVGPGANGEPPAAGRAGGEG